MRTNLSSKSWQRGFTIVIITSSLLITVVVSAHTQAARFPPQAPTRDETPPTTPNSIYLPLVVKSDARLDPDDLPQVTVLSSSSTEIVLEVIIPSVQFREQVAEGITYQRLYLPGIGTTTETGKPELPTFGYFVAVPMGAEPRVEILNETPLTDLPAPQGAYRIYPAQPPQGEIGPEPPFQLDAGFYERDVSYPGQTVTVDAVTTLRGVNAAVVRFFPVQFNPAQGQLRVLSRLRVRISFPEGSGQFLDRRLWSRYFESGYDDLLLNYPLLEAELAHGEEAVASPMRINSLDGADLLIITDPAFVEQANTLAHWKRLKGIDTEVRTTTQTGTTATAIRNYLLNAYNNWTLPPSFILLLGDAEFIPTHYVTVHPWSCSGCDYAPGARVGTDLYYADMTGNYYPELAIGRIPVSTDAEAATVVNKIINYERTPPTHESFYSSATVVAYFEDLNLDGYSDRRWIKTSEEMRDFMRAQGYAVNRAYYAQPEANPTHYNDGPYANGEPLPAELLRPAFAWDGWTADIQNAFNAGRFLITHRDHGLSRNGDRFMEGWQLPRLRDSDAQALQNGSELPVVFSINCETGWFDGETDYNAGVNSQSLAEVLLLHPGGGAAGIIAATRGSWTGYNDFMIRGLIDAIWPHFVPDWGSETPEYRLGQILNIGKLSMVQFWGDPSGYQLIEFEEFHYFGDPTMEIWTAYPAPLSVSHPETLAPGATSMTVDVAQADALVSLVKDDQIIATATSSAGSATLSFDPLSDGIIYLTVTKHNHLPYEGSVPVTDPSVTPTVTPTPTPTETPLPSLQGYWTMDEPSGQRLDSSGRSNHLTDNNTVGSIVGQTGLAADLESDRREYLSIGDAAQDGLNIAGSLTLVGWINAERVNRWQIMAAKYEWGVENRAYRFGLNDASVLHFVVSPDGQYLDPYILEGQTPLAAGTWHHVAAVFDAPNRTMTLYLDGRSDASRAVTFDHINLSTAPFMLGANLSNGNLTQFFDGQLDEWRVYDRALTRTQIQDLMALPTFITNQTRGL